MHRRSRESNTDRPHTLEAYRTIPAPHATWRVCGSSHFKMRRPPWRSMDSPTPTQLDAGKTRRSTSGGSLRIGRHTLAPWSSTRKVVSLSSAESEYHGVVRCASEAIGLANAVRELGHEAHARIWTGAAAARGLALRSGSGAIKHMEQSTSGCSRRIKTKSSGSRRSVARSIPLT